MENSSGSINVFVSGVLPKEKYSDANELAKDIASILRVDQDRIVVDLIALESLKGEEGAEGPRGLQGEKGAKGDKGDSGAPGSIELNPFVLLQPSALDFTWNMLPDVAHQNAGLILTGANVLIMNNLVSGMSGTLLVHNVPGTGTLSLPANSRYLGGTKIIITPTANAVDVLHWEYFVNHFYWTAQQNFLP